jgi:hypothetical protein
MYTFCIFTPLGKITNKYEDWAICLFRHCLFPTQIQEIWQPYNSLLGQWLHYFFMAQQPARPPAHKWATASSLLRLHDHIHTHTTIGRTPLDEWSALCRDFYLLNTQHLQETNVHAPAGFEPAIPARERPQTRALDRAATGIGQC